MSWTKRQFIEQGFAEIGLAKYNFDLSPEMYQDGLTKLDAMISAWQNSGIRLGYPITDNDLDVDSNIPIQYNEAVYLNLAVRLAPSYGKQVMADTKVNAKAAYDGLLIEMTKPQPLQNQATVSGAGNWQSGYIRDEFITQPKEPITTGQDGILNIGDL